MKTRKAGKKPADDLDPGSYAESEITPEDRKRAKDAAAQAKSGANPPSWAVSEDLWERAKEAAGETYEEGDDAYWPAVVHIYGNMGGEVQGKSSKSLAHDLAKYGTPEGAAAGHATQGHNAEGGGADRIGRISSGVNAAKEKMGRARTLLGVKNPPEESVQAVLRDVADSASEAVMNAYAAADGSNEDVKAEFRSIGAKVTAQVDRLAEAKDSASRIKALSSLRSTLNRLGERAVLAGFPAEKSLFAKSLCELCEDVCKAMHAHEDMADVVEMMSEYEMSESDMVEHSGLDADRVKALLHDGAKPTDDELDAMMQACEECEEDDAEMGKHGDHDQSTHGSRGASAKPGSRAGKGSLARAGKAFENMRSSMTRIFEQSDDADTREDAKAVMGHVKDAREALGNGDNEKYHASLGRARDRAILAASTAKTRRDQTNLRAAARHIETQIRNVRKDDAPAIASESLLKAGLGMSDGEFRRKLTQAVYARWGKQASIDETFPDTQIAIVRAWEGDVWASAYRLLSVPYDTEGGVVTLGEVAGEVRQTYEPVEKALALDDEDGSTCEVEYVADRAEGLAAIRGEYVINGLNGEAHTLAKSLSDAGARARVEDVADGSHRVVFESRSTARQLAIRATVDGEFEAEQPRGFVPFVRDEATLRKAEEKGIAYGIVYEPDVVDKQGEWATADDIEEAAHEYLKRSRRMKRQHEDRTDSEIVESYVAPADFLLGNRVVRKGSWVVAVKMGETARKLYKAGKLTGLSMGGSCAHAG